MATQTLRACILLAMAAIVVTSIILALTVSTQTATSPTHINRASISTMRTCAAAGVRRRACDGSDHDTKKWAGAARSSFLYAVKQSSAAQVAARPSASALSAALCVQPSGTPKHTQFTSLVWSFGQAFDHAITLVGGAQTTAPINLITHFVDGNMLYGSDVQTVMQLREWKHGRMLLVEAGDGGDTLLPPPDGADETQRAVGDVRGNVQPSLMALHSLFLREHNFQARRLASANPTWNDECLYHAAREIIEAEFRAVVFDEFIPALLGAPLSEPAFNASCSVQITAEFAAAAYRLHTLVTEHVHAYDPESGEHRASIALRDAFFHNEFVEQHGVGALLLGQVLRRSEAADLRMVDSLRAHLFNELEDEAHDLAARNIESGRAQRIADFSTLRAHYRPDAGALTDWASLGAPADVQAALEQLYASPSNIDAWVGLNAEAPQNGAPLPPTITAVLREQFTRLRDCDPLYFSEPAAAADRAYVTAHGSLRDIILRNTNVRAEHLPQNLFKV